MQIQEKDLVKFKELVRETVGEEKYNVMTEQDLLEQAIKLLTLIKIAYKPITQKECDFIQAHREATILKVVDRIIEDMSSSRIEGT